LARKVASSRSLIFPCWRIVWYVFFTAVLPSRFRNPILRNQAEPPLNFQLWPGHPPRKRPNGHRGASFLFIGRGIGPECGFQPKTGPYLLLGILLVVLLIEFVKRAFNSGSACSHILRTKERWLLASDSWPEFR
jgi:hypothetical protein